MEYNEQAFKEKANLKAMKVWLALIAIMTLSYGSDLSKGIYTATQYVVFLVMAWVPFAIGLLTLKLKGRATPYYKDVLALGYGFFYAYVVCITDSATAYAYILPLTSMLILFKDRSYMIRCAVTNEIVIVISAILHVFLGLNPNVKMTDYYLQFSTLLLCYICYILSVDHLNESDGALVASIRDNLSRVVTTVGQVKGASNSIVDGVTVVRELADENRQGADSVVSSMEELTRNNDVLHNKTMSSMDRSTDISTQVQNVAGLIDEMVTLIQESVEHADVSAEELADVMNTTDTMAALSGEVEQVLENFKQKFEMVKEETGTIKGFAVVAGQIQDLSMGTKTSSGRIRDALDHLEETSEKMTESITKTLEMIRMTREKLTQVQESVTSITDDSKKLGQNIGVIDGAMKEVEASNSDMVENMKQICDTMEVMTECINQSDEASRTMLSKYEESSVNVDKIESVVGKLMEELGSGGFMGIGDVQPGMHVVLVAKNGAQAAGTEFHGEVFESQSDGVLVKIKPEAGKTIEIKKKDITYELQICVNNALYTWEDVSVSAASNAGADSYRIAVATNPKVINRRKYPRMPVANACTVTLKKSGKAYNGRMINISAGGFAFSAHQEDFANAIGQDILLEIPDFPLEEARTLDGHIIRSTDNDGEFIVGCRMPEDSEEIQAYVNKNYRE